MTTTSFAASMAVNTLVTGLIVFKILKVFMNVKTTSVERALGTTGGSAKLRHIIFVIIESGMMLFAIQLIRLVFVYLPAEWAPNTFNIVNAIDQMLNVIIKIWFFFFFSFYL